MTQAKDIADLVHRLDVSGADRTRWPAQERLRFASLIAQSEEAQRLVAEAAAFDRLLDQVPGVSGGKLDGLVDKIVAAAEAEGRPEAGNVVPMRAATAGRPKQPAARPAIRPSTWSAAALMAASLLIGAFVGTSGLLGSAVPSLQSEFAVAEADLDGLDAAELLLDGDRTDLFSGETL